MVENEAVTELVERDLGRLKNDQVFRTGHFLAMLEASINVVK